MIIAIVLICILGLITLANFIHVTPPIQVGEPLKITEESPKEVRAIQLLTDKMAAGWNKGDGSLFASVFTEEADYITFNGEWLRGQQGIMQSHQQLFDGPLKGSKLENQEIVGIRAVSQDTLIVHMTGYVKVKWRRKAPEARKSIQTLVAVKDDGIWKFTAFHNSRIHRFTVMDGLKMFLN